MPRGERNGYGQLDLLSGRRRGGGVRRRDGAARRCDDRRVLPRTPAGRVAAGVRAAPQGRAGSRARHVARHHAAHLDQEVTPGHPKGLWPRGQPPLSYLVESGLAGAGLLRLAARISLLAASCALSASLAPMPRPCRVWPMLLPLCRPSRIAWVVMAEFLSLRFFARTLAATN